MTRAQAMQMLDDAYVELFKVLFNTLHASAIERDLDEGAGRFETGVRLMNDARGRAEQVLERLFPE